MTKKMLAIGLLAVVLSIFPAVNNVRAGNATTSTTAYAETNAATPIKVRRFGPYATLRRANEVANYARRLGYRAKVIYAGSFYAGTRKYYVDVWV